MHTRAIHVGADLETDDVQRGSRSLAAADAVQRAAQICRRAGIVEQRTLIGAGATQAALIAAVQEAVSTLARDGLLVLTFAGPTLRGDGPLAMRWRLFDGSVELSQVAAQLARLPPLARLIVIAETCDATAIASCLRGPQLTVVIAGAGPGACACTRAFGRADPPMHAGASNELMARLERLLCSGDGQASLAEVSRALQADAADCQRPCVWTNVADWWSARALDIFANTA